MSDQPIAGWTPLTMWNVGKIGVKSMIRFEDAFSTNRAHAQFRYELEQSQLRRERHVLHPSVDHHPRTPRNRPGRHTVAELRSRYNI